MAQSSIRPPVTAAMPQLPTHSLPLPPPGMATTMPTPASQPHMSAPHLSSHHSQLSHLSGMHSSSSVYSQYNALPESVHSESSTPWWVWFVGGAFAVGLGIAGALWYAGSSPEPAPAPVTQPTANPIDPTTATPKLVELRFDSLPSGGVYAEGRSAELCKTPCNFNVDLTDGGPTGKRTFVVRADGYEDSRVEVDFTKSERDFSVSLTKVPTVVGPTQPEPVVDMTKQEPIAEKSSGKKTGKKGKKAEAKAEPKVEEKVEEKKVEEKKPVVDDTKLEPIEKKPDEKKTGPIDPSDTIDPFRRKK